jgi:hypothetical protein
MIICGMFSRHTTHLFLQFVSPDNSLFKLLPSRNQKLLSGILTLRGFIFVVYGLELSVRKWFMFIVMSLVVVCLFNSIGSLLEEVVPPWFFSPRKKTQEKKTKVSHFFGNESTGLNRSGPVRHKKTTVFLGQLLHDSFVVSRIH